MRFAAGIFVGPVHHSTSVTSESLLVPPLSRRAMMRVCFGFWALLPSLATTAIFAFPSTSQAGWFDRFPWRRAPQQTACEPAQAAGTTVRAISSYSPQVARSTQSNACPPGTVPIPCCDTPIPTPVTSPCPPVDCCPSITITEVRPVGDPQPTPTQLLRKLEEIQVKLLSIQREQTSLEELKETIRQIRSLGVPTPANEDGATNK